MRVSHVVVFLEFLGLLIGHATAQAKTSFDHDKPKYLPGVVIESFSKDGIAEKAGLRQGDILTRWVRQKSDGAFRSPFDVSHIEIDQGSRGRVTVEGYRRGHRLRRVLGSGNWGIRARPRLSGDLLSTYQSGQKRIDAGDAAQGIRIWQAAVAHAAQEPAAVRGWLLFRIAEQFVTLKRWDEADSSFKAAMAAAQDASPVERAELLHRWGQAREAHDNLVGAERCYRQMLQERQKLASESMAIRAALSSIGIVLLKEGKLGEAEAMFRRALVVGEKIAPGSSGTAVTLANLGVVLDQKGEYAQADYFYRSALRVERRTPGLARQYSVTLVNLGALNYERGDLPTAQQYFRKALAVAQEVDPESLDVATILSHLSLCLVEQGHPAAAEQYELRALSIRRRQSPGSVSVTFSLLDLGSIARARQMLTKAEAFYREAVEVLKKLPPPHPELASALSALGDVLSDEGRLEEAEKIFRRTLAMLESMTPEGPDHAQAVADLARVLRKQGRVKEARPLYAQALGEYETLAGQLGGVEQDLVGYRARYEGLAKEYVELLMDQGEHAQAFEFADAFRGRVMAQLLSEGHLDIRNGADPQLLKSEQTLRAKIRAATEKRLRLTGANGPSQVRDPGNDIEALEARYKEVERQIRNTGGKYAGLVQPTLLSLVDIQRLLDPDTLLLEYSLGRQRSFLWVVGQRSLHSYRLGPRAQIDAAARRLYHAVSNLPGDVPRNSAAKNEEYEKAAALLSKLILSPAGTLLGKKRLAVVTDGPLEYIPFAVLPDPRQPTVPLIVNHELVSLPSAAVLAELRQHRHSEPSFKGEVAVIADPVFNSSDDRVEKSKVAPNTNPGGTADWAQKNDMLAHSASDTRMVRRGQVHLARLFYSRKEAEAILSSFGSDEVLQALGFHATRALAMSQELSRYRIVHFATHGLVDSQRPEYSGLVLSLVNAEGQPQDGFLQLDDIYSLNLPVDLVVLSGCQTALGRDVEGEGLIGMTRGFIYAGANRVIASMWSVSDLATSELMARFYRAMKQDKIAPAAALRLAQIQMWKQRRWRHPYYWAAFKLEGEWN